MYFSCKIPLLLSSEAKVYKHDDPTRMDGQPLCNTQYVSFPPADLHSGHNDLQLFLRQFTFTVSKDNSNFLCPYYLPCTVT